MIIESNSSSEYTSSSDGAMESPESTANESDAFLQQVADQIIGEWPKVSACTFPQTVVLIGGYIGSGKSTLADGLVQAVGFSLLSTDRIRSLLRERGQLNPDNTKTVERALLASAVSSGRSLVVSANAHRKRLDEVAEFLKQHDGYRVLKLFLSVPLEVLKERVSSRQARPGEYLGTLENLNGQRRLWTLDPNDYDLVIEHTAPIDETLRLALEGLKHVIGLA